MQHLLRITFVLLFLAALCLLAVGAAFSIEDSVADHNAALERALCAEGANRDDCDMNRSPK